MNAIRVAFENALLADASYVNELVDELGQGKFGTQLASALSTRMTPKLAEQIAKRFSVVTQHSRNGPSESGFDVTVWRANNDDGTPNPAGKTYVSMRGTAGSTDILADAQLALTGLAAQQLADMVNWWLRETTAPNQLAQQIAVAGVGTMGPGGTTPSQTGQFVAAASVQGTGRLEGVVSVEAVNGHSLGGYMAASFARVFGGSLSIGGVNTFNSAGFGRLASAGIQAGFEQIAALLGPGRSLPSFADALQQNNFAENGINVTTNTWNVVGFRQVGNRVALFQEDRVRADEGGVSNHFMFKLTDMLAIGDVLARLDSGLTIERLNSLMKSGSNVMDSSYEGVLDSLRKLFGTYTAPTAVGDAGEGTSEQPLSRRDLHTNLADLKASAAFKQLQDKLTFTQTHSADRVTLRNDFAAFLGVELGLPFAVAAKDTTATDLLKQAHEALAARWEADVSLTDAQRAAGLANYSEAYSLDRSAFANRLIQANERDVGYAIGLPLVRSNVGEPVRYDDRASSTVLTVAPRQLSAAVLEALNVQRITFGSANPDQIDGAALADRLYGGDGADNLDGKAGADHLEGQAGDDTLNGGDGDKAADTLWGGKGQDTYVFNGSFGRDTVVDADGRGSLHMDGVNLSGLGWKRVGENFFESAAGSYQIRRVPGVGQDAKASLTITRKAGGGAPNANSLGDAIIVNGYSDGYFGISLPEVPVNSPLPTFSQVVSVRPDGDIGGNVVINQFSFETRVPYSFDPVLSHYRFSDYRVMTNHSFDDDIANPASSSTWSGNDLVYTNHFARELVGGLPWEVVQGGRVITEYTRSASAPNRVMEDRSLDEKFTSGDAGGFYFGAGGADVFGVGGGDDVVLTSQATNWPLVSYRSHLLRWAGRSFGEHVAAQNVSWTVAASGHQFSLQGLGRGLALDDSFFAEMGVGSRFELSGGSLYDASTDSFLSAVAGQSQSVMDNSLYDLQGDEVDAGAGNDVVVSSRGDDTIDGGSGNDTLIANAGNDLIFGGEGDDDIAGDSTVNYLLDEAGNVLGVDRPGVDVIEAGDGNDFVSGGGESDIIYGGAGNDELSGDESLTGFQVRLDGGDWIDGGEGNDLLIGGGQQAGQVDELFGGTGDDNLWGDDSPNSPRLTAAWRGVDKLYGGAGDDNLVGGGGADELFGDDGDDWLFGDDLSNVPGGYAIAAAEHGDDLLDGGAGNDELRGGGGADTLHGGTGDDLLEGGDGNDVLLGGDGNDYLYGGEGNDVLVGGAGADQLFGGAGNDRYVFDAADIQAGGSLATASEVTIADTQGVNDLAFEGVSGDDLRIQSNGTQDLALEVAGQRVRLVGGLAGSVQSVSFNGGAQQSLQRLVATRMTQAVQQQVFVSSSASGTQEVWGGAGDDSISVQGNYQPTSQVTRVATGRGNDTINADGADLQIVINPGDGKDTLQGWGGSHTVLAGEGFNPADARLQIVDGRLELTLSADRSDKIRFENVYPHDVSSTSVLREVRFHDGATLDFAALLARRVRIEAPTGSADFIDGTGVADELIGSDLNDTVYAEGGNDLINAKGGENVLYGGAGNDTYVITQGSTNTVHDESGALHLRWLGAATTSDISITWSGQGNDLQLTDAQGTAVNLVGGLLFAGRVELELADGIRVDLSHWVDSLNGISAEGSWQADDMVGTAQGDQLQGDSGADRLSGRGGNDLLVGDEGNDALNGGTGDDLLFGGAGDDTYVFELGFGADVLFDREGVNTLRFGAGLLAADMVVTADVGEGSLTMRFPSGDAVRVADGLSGVVQKVEFADGAVLGFSELLGRLPSLPNALIGDDIANSLVGTAASELISGLGGDDTLRGNAGNDILEGGSGDDLLEGGVGDDQLRGGDGDDTYVLRLGDGIDRLTDTSGSSVLRFGPGINLSDVAVSPHTDEAGQDWYRLSYSASDAVLLKVTTGLPMVALELSDGRRVPLEEVMSRTYASSKTVSGTPGNDLLYGFAGNDMLTGGDGNDVLIAGHGDDLLDGGAGNDELRGGEGADRYVLSQSQGTDVIVESGTALSTLVTGVSSVSDLVLERRGQGLWVNKAGDSGGALLRDFFTNDTSWALEFADGTSLNVRQRLAQQAASAESAAQRRDSFYQMLVGEQGRVQLNGVYVDQPSTTTTVLPNGDETVLAFTRSRSVLEVDEQSADFRSVRSGGQRVDLIRQFQVPYSRTVQRTVIDYNTIELAATNTAIARVLQANIPGVANAYEIRNADGMWVPSWGLSLGFSGQLYTTQDGPYTVYWSYQRNFVTTATPRTVTVVETGTETVSNWRTTYSYTDTISDVRAGASASTLRLFGTSNLIDAGGGDDVVIRPSAPQWGWWTTPDTTVTAEELLSDDRTGDWVHGGDGNDVLRLGAANDELSGGGGSDLLAGGAGNDTYVIDPNDDGWDTLVEPGLGSIKLDIAFADITYGGQYGDNSELLESLALFESLRPFGELMTFVDQSVGGWTYANSFKLTEASGTALVSLNDVIQTLRAKGAQVKALDDSTESLGGWSEGRGRYSLSFSHLVGSVDRLGLSLTDLGSNLQLPTGQTADALVGGNQDVLRFGAGIGFADLRARWIQLDIDGTSRNALEVSWGQTQGRGLRIASSSPTSFDLPIELLQFADGSSVRADELLTLATPPQTGPTRDILAAASPVTINVREDVDFTATLLGQLFEVQSGVSVESYVLTTLDDSELPSWLSFDPQTLTLTGRATDERLGPLSLRVTATTSNGLQAYKVLTVNVQPVNDAPVVLEATPYEVSVSRGQSLSWHVPVADFTDTDVGDRVMLSVLGESGAALPRWLSFDPISLTLRGTPPAELQSDVVLQVRATDLEGAFTYKTLRLALQRNVAPQVNAIDGQTAPQNSLFSYAAASAFTDPDAGDVLSYSASLDNGDPLPSWLSFDAATGTFIGTPGNEHVGSLSLRVTATDQGGLSASASFDLTVANVNDAPTVAIVPANQAATWHQPFSFVLPANAFADVDVGDVLTTSLRLDDGSAAGAPLPSWLSFDAATRTVSGTAPWTAPTELRLRYSATDLAGASATSTFNLTLSGTPTLVGTDGNDSLNGTNAVTTGTNPTPGRDYIVGGAGNDTLNGRTGADRMEGGIGNDTYFVDNTGDAVVELAGEGGDRVVSTIDYALGTNVEDLQLSGTANLNGTGNELSNLLLGNAGANTLTGLAGDDRLVGGAGADTLIGGEGNDLYEVDNTGDQVVEQTGQGLDTIEASVSYTLPTFVENLLLTGTGVNAQPINATGNAGANYLQGNDAANTLMGLGGDDTLLGGKGADTLVGGDGDDTYLFEDDIDTVVETADGGRDAIVSSLSFVMPEYVEDGLLASSAASVTGNSLNNVLTGNASANTLDGGAGEDILIGGRGNDVYTVDHQADTVVEIVNEGTDEVRSSVTYALADHVEHLTLTGNAVISGRGNDLANRITGNARGNTLYGEAGNDTMDGGSGADILIGGTGNDIYRVDDADDAVVELAAEGTDHVFASVSHQLAANLENLTLTGSAHINAVGNNLNNRIEGNSGNNVLFGGLGNDTYVFQQGFGRDVIVNFDAGKPSGDTIQFGSGINAADVQVIRDGDDLVLQHGSDQVTAFKFFENSGRGDHGLERVRFADGSTWNYTAVLARANAQTGASDAGGVDLPTKQGNPAALTSPSPASRLAEATGNDAPSSQNPAPQSVSEAISQARARWEAGLRHLKDNTEEQAGRVRAADVEARGLPLLWNLQDALLNARLSDAGRFATDISIDSRVNRDLTSATSLLGGTRGVSTRLDQVQRMEDVAAFDVAGLR